MSLLASRWRLLREQLENAPAGFTPALVEEFILPTIELPTFSASAAGVETVGATAAERSHVQLFNPANSGVLIKPLMVWVQMTAIDNAIFRVHDTALATQETTTIARLTRGFGDTSGVVGQVRSRSDSAVGTSFNQISILAANETREIDLRTWGVRLHPGRGLLVIPGSDNVGLTVSWYWEEVPIV